MSLEHWTEGVIDPEDWYVYVIALGLLVVAGIYLWRNRDKR
jgi:hypothetical protein